MNRACQRLCLYGAAAAMLAGLGMAALNNEADADVVTLLSGADTQLRLAYGMPAVDLQGNPLDSRAHMIREAIALLERAEQQSPGMAVTAEFRGFAHMLVGEFAAAAECYVRARGCEDCDAAQFDLLVFNEARMRGNAGDREGALRVLSEHADALDSRFGHQRLLEEAGILRQLGRPADALSRLEALFTAGPVEPATWAQAGFEFERLGADGRAALAFERAAESLPIANYHLARLKLREGAVDTAVECLKRAAAAVPAEVRRLVHREPEAWQALAGDEWFGRFTKPVAATPGR